MRRAEIALFALGALSSLGLGCGRSPTAGRASALAFTEVSREAGLAEFRHHNGAEGKKWFPEMLGAGAAWLDYDRDGWADLLLVPGGRLPGAPGAPIPALALYRNLGNGHFRDVTAEAGLGAVSAYGMGVFPADYDNDGDPDFLFTTLAGNRLFENEGGHFQEVTERAGLAGGEAWTTAAVFFDADNDGWLDLYVGSYVAWSPEQDIWCTHDGQSKSHCSPEVYSGLPGHFFRNDHHGRFQDQTAPRGFAGAPGKTLGALAFDYDRDGWSDVYVANDTERNLLYHGRGDGTFEEVGVAAGVAFDENGRARAGMGVAAGVVDASGEASLFVGNFSKESIGAFRRQGAGFSHQDEPSRLAMQSLLTLTFGLVLADLDLDGDLDLVAANGHVREEDEGTGEGIRFREPLHVFTNDGGGVFEDQVPRLGGAIATPLLGRGAAYADYDHDGDLDLLITENDGPVHLFRNEAAGRDGAGWLRFHLLGSRSNRDALGSRIEVEAGGRQQVQEVRAGGSYLSSSELTATFGLGNATAAERVKVRFPSGAEVELRNVPAGTEQTLTEPAAEAPKGAQ
ncbi:MAG: CRTAC1 family protein [Thermoanaerobaculia bacterium]